MQADEVCDEPVIEVPPEDAIGVTDPVTGEVSVVVPEETVPEVVCEEFSVEVPAANDVAITDPVTGETTVVAAEEIEELCPEMPGPGEIAIEDENGEIHIIEDTCSEEAATETASVVVNGEVVEGTAAVGDAASSVMVDGATV